MVSHSIGRGHQPSRPPRVYWAEDAQDDQVLIRHALADIPGAPQVTFFEDGRDLLEGLADETPDLVVLDIRMPRLTGVETLRAIRKDPRLAGLPVTMFSTAAVEREMAECATLGVLDYVQKPTAFAEFTAAVQRVIDSLALKAANPQAS